MGKQATSAAPGGGLLQAARCPGGVVLWALVSQPISVAYEKSPGSAFYPLAMTQDHSFSPISSLLVITSQIGHSSLSILDACPPRFLLILQRVLDRIP